MFPRLSLIIMALACAGSCPAASPSGTPSAIQPPLRWAADAEGGAPYVSKDPENLDHLVGFEVDLATALEKELAAASSSSNTISDRSWPAWSGATLTSP